MDYEGAVEVINQLEAGSSSEEEFTIDALKAINNEIKFKGFTRQQNDEEAAKLIKSLSGPFLFQQQTARPQTSVPQPQLKVQSPIQPKSQAQPQPVFSVQQQPKPAPQTTSAKELSAATEELKSTIGPVSKLELPKLKFNVKPKEVKIPPVQEAKPVPNMPTQQPSPAVQAQAPVQQKQPVVKKEQNVQQKTGSGKSGFPDAYKDLQINTCRSAASRSDRGTY